MKRSTECVHPSYEDRRGCYFFGGVISAITGSGGGGGGSTSSSQNVTNVDVEVNPEINADIAIDLSAVSDAFEAVNDQNAATNALFADALNRQTDSINTIADQVGQGFQAGFDALGNLSEKAGAVIAVAGAAFLIWRFAK